MLPCRDIFGWTDCVARILCSVPKTHTVPWNDKFKSTCRIPRWRSACRSCADASLQDEREACALGRARGGNNPYAESLANIRTSIFLVTVKKDRRRRRGLSAEALPYNRSSRWCLKALHHLQIHILHSRHLVPFTSHLAGACRFSSQNQYRTAVIGTANRKYTN